MSAVNAWSSASLTGGLAAVAGLGLGPVTAHGVIGQRAAFERGGAALAGDRAGGARAVCRVRKMHARVKSARRSQTSCSMSSPAAARTCGS